MNLRSNKGKYEGFRSFGVEKPPYLGDVTQVKKKLTDLYTADMWRTIDRELSRMTPVSFAVEEQLTTSSPMAKLQMFGIGR